MKLNRPGNKTFIVRFRRLGFRPGLTIDFSIFIFEGGLKGVGEEGRE